MPFFLTATVCQPLEPIMTGPLLGVFDEAEWPVTHASLPPGGTILLYTDGLIEARRGADTFGIERACEVLAAERRSAVELRVERLIDAARRHEDQACATTSCRDRAAGADLVAGRSARAQPVARPPRTAPPPRRRRR